MNKYVILLVALLVLSASALAAVPILKPVSCTGMNMVTLQEGENKNVLGHSVTLIYVDNQNAKLTIDGIKSDKTLLWGTSQVKVPYQKAPVTFTVRNILYQAYAGGVHSATVCVK
jgi:uncharacterized membrane protein